MGAAERAPRSAVRVRTHAPLCGLMGVFQSWSHLHTAHSSPTSRHHHDASKERNMGCLAARVACSPPDVHFDLSRATKVHVSETASCHAVVRAGQKTRACLNDQSPFDGPFPLSLDRTRSIVHLAFK